MEDLLTLCQQTVSDLRTQQDTSGHCENDLDWMETRFGRF